VEMQDGTVLIAGGIEELHPQCDDWSDPSCAENPVATAEIYTPATGSFAPVGDSGSSLMTSKRVFAAAVKLPSGEIALFGGLANGSKPTESVDIFDPVTQTFTSGPVMQDTRAYHTATLISSDDDGSVLLVGGHGTGETSWEVWTPTQGSVGSGSLHQGRWNHTATLLSRSLESNLDRDTVVLVGGEGGGDPGAAMVRDSLEIFDIDANQLDSTAFALCTNQGEASPVAARKTMHATAYVPKRHFLYIAGGFKDAQHLEPTKDICVWNTRLEKWVGEAGTFMLKKERGGLTATPMPGNAVLFAGGLTKEDGGLQVAETVEIVFEYLNQNGETVVDIGPGYPIVMVWPRWSHQALMGADGSVLLMGGLRSNVSSPQPSKETEIFNPQYY
jgi:hypothetical protein